MISWQPVMNKVYTMVRVLKLQIHPKYVWTSIIIIIIINCYYYIIIKLLKPASQETVTRALQVLVGQPVAYILVL